MRGAAEGRAGGWPTLLLGLALAVSVSAEVDSTPPDLEVTHLSRLPRCSSYQGRVEYAIQHVVRDDFEPYAIDFARGLRGQGPSTKRWPDAGEAVTWTAHVRNRGSIPVERFAWQWTLDGAVLASGEETRRLEPGRTVTFRTRWPWEFAPHRIRFEASVAEDATPSNNSVEDFTNALTLFSFIDEGYERRFRDETGQVENPTTDSVFEWLQRHRARMNELFERADSPLRWRYDRLELVADGAELPAYERSDWDGDFPARFRAADKDLRLGGSGYYRKDDDIDYGLLHEIGHQLGIIDVYRINLAPEQNEVNGQGYSTVDCLMNGCSPLISAHTAGAMAAWHGKRRGYFGQYLYDLPASMKVRFLDSRGRPLEDATIEVFQKILGAGQPERIPDKVKFRGTTGGDGIFELPNVPVRTAGFDADLPNILAPNPFGYISNHGANGLFLMRVSKGEMTDHVWLDIVEANLAFWRGQTGEAVFDRKTAIGEGIQHEPPDDLCENNAASWSVWAQQGTIAAADDPGEAKVGAASVRLAVSGGFDNYARYPADTLAKWDLSGAKAIRFWCRAVNRHAFQNASPWIRLGNHKRGWFEWKPPGEVLNEAIGKWVEYVVPLAGDSGWKRSVRGSPDLSEINYFELHADTWDYGFQLWLDGVRFER